MNCSLREFLKMDLVSVEFRNVWSERVNLINYSSFRMKAGKILTEGYMAETDEDGNKSFPLLQKQTE